MNSHNLDSIVLLNGKVRTVNPKQPLAEGVAIRDGKIQMVGSTDDVKTIIGPSTQTIDLDGKLVLPGFIDCHVHFLSGGRQLLSINLRDVRTEVEFIQRIKLWAEKCIPGQWITGGNWDQTSWPSGQLPCRDWIDKHTQENPVFIARIDHHLGLANSLALKLAGITKDTPDPQGGLIVRDKKTNEPTGILKETAMGLVGAVIPNPTKQDNLNALRAAMKEAARCGVTSVQDCTQLDDVLNIHERALKQDELITRICARTSLSNWEKQSEYIAEHGLGNDWLRLDGVKGFADGSLGAKTAKFFEPYSDAPDTCGIWSTTILEGKLESLALDADKAGLQLSVHAIGDEANHLMLEIYRRIVQKHGRRDRRLRIEHAQHIHPEDFERFAELDVIASVQPYHAIDDGRWVLIAIGRKRSQTTYAFRTFIDHKVKLAFGSDWPVAPLDPLLGIYAAVTRQTTDGKNPDGWFPKQKISVEEAVRAYTIDAAYAAFEENIKGSIEVEKCADLVVLSEDIFSIEPEDIKKAEIVLTMVGGKLIEDFQ
ncbi:amidohydrolase [bacterium]|nr:amidohydrolase [bacterium]